MIDALIEIIENLSWDLEIRFHGIYNGYGMFEGVAVTAGSTSILYYLGVQIGQCKELEQLHDANVTVDPFGTGVIVAWPTRLWSEEDLSRIRNNEFEETESDEY